MFVFITSFYDLRFMILKNHRALQDTHSATLVSIETQDQHDFVIMMIGFLSSHEDSHIWWTSGTDTGREGEWYWASTLTAVGRFIWSQSNQPDGLLAANCLSLGSRSGTGYDDTCTLSYYPFFHHYQGSIDFNTVNIHRTVGMYFLISTGNRGDIE